MSYPIFDAINSFLNTPLRPEFANLFLKNDPYIHVDAIAGTYNSGVDAYRASDGGYYIPADEDFVPPTIGTIVADDNPVNDTSASRRNPSTPQQTVYTDAPYAEMYGMSARTAYEEALLNTAHQREVADLKAAGLNPVLGISGAGAGSGATPVLQGSGSVNSGKSGKDFDWLDALPFIGYAIGAAASLKSGNPSLGANTGKNIGEALKIFAAR